MRYHVLRRRCLCFWSRLNRWYTLSPCYDFLCWTAAKDFLKGNYDYDFLNPSENKLDYREVREKLIEVCTDFVKRMEKVSSSIEELNKFTYMDAEIHD